MLYTTTAIQEFLAHQEPFAQLPEQATEKLAQSLQPLRYRMGQVIVMREKMPAHLALLYEGQARRLGYDPRTQMPVTLELLKPGAVIGWVNLVRGIATETALASTEVVCLSCPESEFVRLLEEFPQWAAQLTEKCSLLEAFDLIGAQLNRQAQAQGDLKQLAQLALNQAQVYQLPPGKVTLRDHPPPTRPRPSLASERWSTDRQLSPRQ